MAGELNWPCWGLYRSLEVKLPTWTDGTAEVGRVREEKRREEERRSEKRKRQKKEDAGARKGRKVAKHCVFPMIRGSGGSKSRLAKAAGVEPSGQMRWEMNSCMPLCRETHLEVKMHKAACSDHFWKLRCQKSERSCGAKHMSKSKRAKYTNIGPVLEVEMSKKCTPLWREAHFQVKSVENWRVQSTFGRSDVVSLGSRKGLCTLSKVSKACRFFAVSTTATATLHSTTTTTTATTTTTLHYATVH